jgi:hypothetical protein
MVGLSLAAKYALVFAALLLNMGTMLYVHGKPKTGRLYAIGREMIYGSSMLLLFIAIAVVL